MDHIRAHSNSLSRPNNGYCRTFSRPSSNNVRAITIQQSIHFLFLRNFRQNFVGLDIRRGRKPSVQWKLILSCSYLARSCSVMNISRNVAVKKMYLEFGKSCRRMFKFRANVCNRVVEPSCNLSRFRDDRASNVRGRDLDDFLVGQTETAGSRMIAWENDKSVMLTITHKRFKMDQVFYENKMKRRSTWRVIPPEGSHITPSPLV